MGLQDLRALIAERSMMTIYIRGETIEVPHQSIGFLLEGFIKPFNVQDELITSPAVLWPSHGIQSFRNADTSGNFNPFPFNPFLLFFFLSVLFLPSHDCYYLLWPEMTYGPYQLYNASTHFGDKIELASSSWRH